MYLSPCFRCVLKARRGAQACDEEKLLGHLGVVLYEYLGEEYPEVLGSILGALKSIVNVIGMTKARPCADRHPLCRVAPTWCCRDWRGVPGCMSLQACSILCPHGKQLCFSDSPVLEQCIRIFLSSQGFEVKRCILLSALHLNSTCVGIVSDKAAQQSVGLTRERHDCADDAAHQGPAAAADAHPEEPPREGTPFFSVRLQSR